MFCLFLFCLFSFRGKIRNIFFPHRGCMFVVARVLIHVLIAFVIYLLFVWFDACIYLFVCITQTFFRALPIFFFALFTISLSITLSIAFSFIRWYIRAHQPNPYSFSILWFHVILQSLHSLTGCAIICAEYSYFRRFVDLYTYLWLLFSAKWRLVVYFVGSKSLNSISLSKRTKTMTKMNANKMTATTPKSFKSNETSWKLNILLDFIILYIYKTVAFKARAFMRHDFIREFHASIETQSNWCHFWFALMNQNQVE